MPVGLATNRHIGWLNVIESLTHVEGRGIISSNLSVTLLRRHLLNTWIGGQFLEAVLDSFFLHVAQQLLLVVIPLSGVLLANIQLMQSLDDLLVLVSDALAWLNVKDHLLLLSACLFLLLHLQFFLVYVEIDSLCKLQVEVTHHVLRLDICLVTEITGLEVLFSTALSELPLAIFVV